MSKQARAERTSTKYFLSWISRWCRTQIVVTFPIRPNKDMIGIITANIIHLNVHSTEINRCMLLFCNPAPYPVKSEAGSGAKIFQLFCFQQAHRGTCPRRRTFCSRCTWSKRSRPRPSSSGRLQGGLQRAGRAGPTPQYWLRQPRAALPVPVPEAAGSGVVCFTQQRELYLLPVLFCRENLPKVNFQYWEAKFTYSAI